MTLDIFHCNDARLHTLPEAPTLRMASREQLVAHHDNLEALNADKIASRFGLDPKNDEEGYRFFTWACHSMLAQEDKWQQCGLVWSWIDERPVWGSPVHWHLDILPDPERPMLRRFRLSLLGGGQIRVSENFVRVEVDGMEPWISCREPELRVTADVGDGLRRYTGIIEDYHNEMAANAAVFLPGTPQSLADRVAQTFRLLSDDHTSVRFPDRDNFMALLDRSEKCCVCRRPLRDHVSTLLGIGPDCARQMRLPHSLDAANRILQRRKQLLGNSQN